MATIRERESTMVADPNSPSKLQGKIRLLTFQLGNAIKVRNILIAAGKVTEDEFSAAEALVRSFSCESGDKGSLE